MRIGLIGLGRMGRVLAARLAPHHELTLFDRDGAAAKEVAAEAGAKPAADLREAAAAGVVILAVPDPEVVSCIKDFNTMGLPLTVINIATNVAQHVLEETAVAGVRCIGVKFVGHAGEIARGSRPVIIVNHRPDDLSPVAEEIFRSVGDVIVGKADRVTAINTMAAEEALSAAVRIEQRLREAGVLEDAVVKSAVRQVAAGIMKAYADDDLGPFARNIVRALKSRSNPAGGPR